MTFQSYLKPPALPRVLTVVEMRVWPPQAFVPLFQPFHAATAVSNMCGTTMNACTQLLKNLGSFFYDAWRPITIHAPREGSDGLPDVRIEQIQISIHAPREGSDLQYAILLREAEQFLSTLPARGATQGHIFCRCSLSFLSTLPARGATAGPCGRAFCRGDFYPRSPRGERPVDT